MFARINTTTRSKPVLVIPPAPSGSPSIPGMLTPPRISNAGSVYSFTGGTYAGEVSRTRAYLINGTSVAGRVSGGSITITGADTGLLVYRETVTGSGGSITRQASMVIMLNILAASVGGVALTQDGHLLSIAAT